MPLGRTIFPIAESLFVPWPVKAAEGKSRLMEEKPFM